MAMGQTLTRLIAAVALVVALPVVAEAQQPGPRVYQVGWLQGGSASHIPETLDPFRRGLREFGWVEGRNMVLVGRFAEGKVDRFPELAAELVRMRVDVIVATAPGVLAAAKNATKTIPIVMVYGPDPVEAGLVASLSRPGGNITGLTSLSADLRVKQLELLKEMVPGISRVGVLWNPTNPSHAASVKRIEVVSKALDLRVQPVGVRGPDEFEAGFEAMARERVGAILGLPDPMTSVHRTRLADLAVKHRLPTMNGVAVYTEAGGLASYWPDGADMFRRAAGYVHRILNGARPGDLPIEQPTKFELIINLKTAKALRLRIPPAVLARADRVIE